MQDAESAQRHIKENIASICNENGIRLRKCSASVPMVDARRRFVGVSEYDRKDMEMPDDLCCRGESVARVPAEVIVFVRSGCETREEVGRMIPEVKRFPAQTPLIALWNGNDCQVALGGEAALCRLRDAMSLMMDRDAGAG